MNKGRKLTLITCARYFYGDEYKSLLVKEFFNTDPEISLAAIKAAAAPGNELAIPYLYLIIEEGVIKQKLQAISALIEIKSPASLTRLIEYFNLFKDNALKTAILHAVNEISFLDAQVQELNKAILLSPGIIPELAEIAVTGLIRSNDTEIVLHHFPVASSQVQKKIIHLLLESPYEQAAAFLKALKPQARDFADDVLGYYLCALEIKQPALENFVIDCFKAAASKMLIRSFLHLLSLYRGEIPHYSKNLLRIMLMLPYINRQSEALIHNFMISHLPKLKEKSSQAYTDLKLMVKTYSETIYQKIKKQFLSVKGEKVKERLLAIVLALLLEKYAGQDLVTRVQQFFQALPDSPPQEIVQSILKALEKAPAEDRNKIKICLPLFTNQDPKTRIFITSTLHQINLERPNLIRRLNRLIRLIGFIQIKEYVKKIAEIAEFAHDEKISFLEESCLEALCQLNYQPTIDNFIARSDFPLSYKFSLTGFLQGARYLAPAPLFGAFIKLLFFKELPAEGRNLILETLAAWDLADIKNAIPLLIKSLRSPCLLQAQREQLASIIIKYADYTHFQSLLDLLQHSEAELKIIYLNILKNIAVKNQTVSRDILINKIYALLEEEKELVGPALLTLFELGDDYAYQVLKEQLNKEDPLYINAFKTYFQNSSGAFKTKLVLDFLFSPHPVIQSTLRAWLETYLDSAVTIESAPAAEEHLKREAFKTTLSQILKSELDEKAVSAVKNHKHIGSENKLINHAKTKFQLLRESTQVLTVLFIDIVNYTQKTTEIDPSALMSLIKDFESTVSSEILNFKGTIVKKMGDGILASFIHPLNGILTSLTIMTRINEMNQFKVEKDKIFVRIGLNTGLVIKKDGDIYGDAVNLASRMETAASPGEILITQSTYEEVKKYIECISLGEIQVKGKAEAIAAYKVLALRPDAGLTAAAAKVSETSSQETIQSYERLSKAEASPVCAYTFPHHSSPLEPKMRQALSDVFTDITSAMEEIARDYHEEKVIKKYLQEQWEKLIRSLN